MKGLLQRVRGARVEVAGEIVGAIDQGLLVLVAVEPSDTPESADKLLISPMVELELKYLYEIGRLTDTAHNIIGDLDAMIGLEVDSIDFHMLIKKSLLIEWTRDPFDRLIVAQCMAKNIKLITKDETIIKNFDGVVV